MKSVTRALIGENDIQKWDGTPGSTTFNRTTSTGGSQSITDFGGGTDWKFNTLQVLTTNPALSTADFSFSTSFKGVAIDVIADSASLTTGAKAIQGQIQINSGAPTATSYQGVAGVAQVNIATEAIGVLGWVDWQNLSAAGAGGFFITRGVPADVALDANAAVGVQIAAEGTGKSSDALRIFSSDAQTNAWRRGIRVGSWSEEGIKILAGPTGGLPLYILSPNDAGADSQTGILLDRILGDVGDSHDIVWGPKVGNKNGRLSLLASSAGESAFVFYAQTGSGDGFSNEVLRVEGAGTTTVQRLKAGGTALVVGDFALSAGWGNTATVSAVSGTDQRFRITVTSAGTGQGANPTITLTFKDGTWTTAPFANVTRGGGSQPTVSVDVTSTTATTLVITFNGTPVAAETYDINCIVVG